MRRALRTLALLPLLGCASTAPDPVDGTDLRVLFIGNSLTYTHDIPEQVAGLSDISGGPRIHVSQVAAGGANLADHWTRGDALDAMALGGWDFVVLQQGPSTLESSRLHLIEWAARFAERIRAVGARPAIYMVWPQDGNFDGVSRSYADAAGAVQGMLLPAGEAFRTITRDHPDIQIFGQDGFHPSRSGAYLAALVIYGQLSGRSMEGVTQRRPVTGLTPNQSAELEQAADRANLQFGID